jgi:hypothetical protein
LVEVGAWNFEELFFLDGETIFAGNDWGLEADVLAVTDLE